MEKAILDYTLVPTGLLLMVAYHIWLLYQIVNRPSRMVMGINAINRRYWVRAMMEDTSKNGVLAVQTLRNNIMASTLLASTAIMLSSLIAVLMSNGTRSAGEFVYGDRSELAFSVKFFSILVCFLVAFLFNVQSVRKMDRVIYFVMWILSYNRFGRSFGDEYYMVRQYVNTTRIILSDPAKHSNIISSMVLQPREHSHQRTVQKDEPSWFPNPEQKRWSFNSGVCGEDSEPWKLFLVIGLASVLLLFPALFVDFRPNSHVH